jgi:hypothetical protein
VAINTLHLGSGPSRPWVQGDLKSCSIMKRIDIAALKHAADALLRCYAPDAATRCSKPRTEAAMAGEIEEAGIETVVTLP